MKNLFLKFGIGGIVTVFPSIVVAQTNVTLLSLSQTMIGYLNMGIELILGLAVLVFVFNVYRYFFFDKESSKERGMYLLWSIIGFTAILCFWGLVNLVANTFGLDNSTPSIFSNMTSGSATNLLGTGSTGSLFSGSNSTGSTNTGSNNTGSNSGSLSGLPLSSGTQYSASPAAAVSNPSNNLNAGNPVASQNGSVINYGNGQSYNTQTGINYNSSGQPMTSPNYNAATGQYTTSGTGTNGNSSSNNGASNGVTAATNNPSNNLNAGSPISSQSGGIIYYGNGQYYDTQTGINYGSNGQQLSSPNYNAATGQYITSGTTGTGGTGSTVQWNTAPGYPCYDASDNVVSCTSGNAVTQSAVYVPSADTSSSNNSNTGCDAYGNCNIDSYNEDGTDYYDQGSTDTSQPTDTSSDSSYSGDGTDSGD